MDKIIEYINSGRYDNSAPFPKYNEVMSKEKRLEMQKAYRQESERLNVLFKSDLLEEYEVTDNPKAEKCFNIAWDMGHSAGYREVLYYFDDFVELIK